VAYLDTKEALETRFLLDRGYSADRLLAINRNPAEVALLTRGLMDGGYPKVKTAGLSWDRAIAERAGERVDVLNFDGTSCAHVDLFETLYDSCQRVRPRVLAVNMLAGREQGGFNYHVKYCMEHEAPTKTTSYGRDVKGTHYGRAWAMLHAITDARGGPCWTHVISIAWDTYLSASGQTMVWFVAEMAPHREIDAGATNKIISLGGLKPACRLRSGFSLRKALLLKDKRAIERSMLKPSLYRDRAEAST
jgi:hypothetical protein